MDQYNQTIQFFVERGEPYALTFFLVIVGVFIYTFMWYFSPPKDKNKRDDED